MNGFDIIGWSAVCISAIPASSRLFQVAAVIKTVREDPGTPFPNPFEGVSLIPIITAIAMVHSMILARMASVPLTLAFRPIPLICCTCLWLFVLICAMIQGKTVSRMSWRSYMEKQIDGFLGIFSCTRDLLQCAESLMGRVPPMVRGTVFLLWVALLIVSIPALSVCPELLSILALLSIGVSAITSACKALHSCRRLLLFWLIYGAAFAVGAGSLVYDMQRRPTSTVVAYIAFVVAFAAIWMLIAGAADNEPAKMACAVINTLTTILLIVINVLVAWCQFPMPENAPFSWDMIQNVSVVILLPLVVGGYLAALLKAMQEYWMTRAVRKG